MNLKKKLKFQVKSRNSFFEDMKSSCVAKMFKSEIKMYHAAYSMSEDIAIIL